MFLEHTAQGNKEIMHESSLGHLLDKATLPNGSQKENTKTQTQMKEQKMKTINPSDTKFKKKY